MSRSGWKVAVLGVLRDPNRKSGLWNGVNRVLGRLITVMRGQRRPPPVPPPKLNGWSAGFLHWRQQTPDTTGSQAILHTCVEE